MDHCRGHGSVSFLFCYLHACLPQLVATLIQCHKGDHFFIRNPKPDFVAAFQQDVLSAIPGSRIQGT